MTEEEKYYALLEAIYAGDEAAIKEHMTDLFLCHVERGIRRKAEAYGYLFEGGVTFTNEEGETSPLLPLSDEAPIVEAIPRLDRRPGEKTSDVIARYFANKEAEKQAAKMQAGEKRTEKAPIKDKDGKFPKLSFGRSRSGRSSPSVGHAGTPEKGDSIYSILSRMRALSQKRKAHRDRMLKGL